MLIIIIILITTSFIHAIPQTITEAAIGVDHMADSYPSHYRDMHDSHDINPLSDSPHFHDNNAGTTIPFSDLDSTLPYNDTNTNSKT